jgi:hypothetical protein
MKIAPKTAEKRLKRFAPPNQTRPGPLSASPVQCYSRAYGATSDGVLWARKASFFETAAGVRIRTFMTY